MNNKYCACFSKAILAGIAISIGCVVNLQIGGVVGAILFSFGLLTCLYFKLALYTGTAGFVTDRESVIKMCIILAGNLIGCLLMGLAIKCALPTLIQSADAIVMKRISLSLSQSLILSILCGFVMTTAVKCGREGEFLPLLFGVPLFILSGFLHSIADAFYLFFANTPFSLWYTYYPTIVIGNFIGCNLYRIITLRKIYE